MNTPEAKAAVRESLKELESYIAGVQLGCALAGHLASKDVSGAIGAHYLDLLKWTVRKTWQDADALADALGDEMKKVENVK